VVLAIVPSEESNPSLMSVIPVFSGDKTDRVSPEIRLLRADLMLQPLFRGTGNNEIDRITHHVHFHSPRFRSREISASIASRPSSVMLAPTGEIIPPLRGGGVSGEEFVLIHISRFDPLL
jgi:hypothetical protein